MFTVGIDFGTTNSVVATVKLDGPVVLEICKNEIGASSFIMPSILYRDSDGNIFVGHDAVSQCDDFSKLITSVKRKIGTEELLCGIDVVEISAQILKKIKNEAENLMQDNIAGCVITVPAHFDDSQRICIKKAAAIAGLKVFRVVNEPTAAAVAYGIDKTKNSYFAVYDLGGGTFDFSILKSYDGVFQVISTGGDVNFGGDDIDVKILELNGVKCEQLTISEAMDAKFSARFLKENLDDHEEISTLLKINGSNLKLTLTQIQIEKIVSDCIKRTLMIADQAIQDANLQKSDISEIILVGAMTKLKNIHQHVADHFDKCNVLYSDHVDEVVALGASIIANDIFENNSRCILIDVTSLSIGIETYGGLVDKLIHRNSPLPFEITQQYTTFADNQTSISFHIVQGERALAKDCKSLAKFTFSNIPPLPAGEVRIFVTFSIDINGILQVQAYQASEDQKKIFTLEPQSNLNQNEIFEIISESAKMKSYDEIKKVEIQNQISRDKISRLYKSNFKK